MSDHSYCHSKPVEIKKSYEHTDCDNGAAIKPCNKKLFLVDFIMESWDVFHFPHGVFPYLVGWSKNAKKKRKKEVDFVKEVWNSPEKEEGNHHDEIHMISAGDDDCSEGRMKSMICLLLGITFCLLKNSKCCASKTFICIMDIGWWAYILWCLMLRHNFCIVYCQTIYMWSGTICNSNFHTRDIHFNISCIRMHLCNFVHIVMYCLLTVMPGIFSDWGLIKLQNGSSNTIEADQGWRYCNIKLTTL